MRRWIREHRRLSIAGAIFAVLLIVGAVGGPPKNRAAQAVTRPQRPHDSATHHRRGARSAAVRRAPAHRSKPTTNAVACRAPSDVLAGVYHPYRLRVLAGCQLLGGIVRAVRHEQDGDVHLDVATDAPYAFLLNSVNRSAQGDALVVEFMARDGGHLPLPSVGDHLTMTGVWVNDADHGWNELHPVWSEQIAGGAVHHSGAQYGGSPAGDSSSTAEADCRNANGQPCQGYVQTATGSPPAPSGSCGSCGQPSSTGRTPSTSAPPSRYRAGEFCSLAKEPSYEAAGYICSPGSDGRERLHTR